MRGPLRTIRRARDIRHVPKRIEHMLVDLTAVVTRIGLISSFAGATK
jgi:hypothetical protein